MPQSESSSSFPHPTIPCGFVGRGECPTCAIEGRLMCHFDRRDMGNFFIAVVPFFTAVITGSILAGKGKYLFAWLAYAVFFFFVWEARVLCSHCPMWAEKGRILRCHANYGVIKLWKYRPGPMSTFEGFQFLAGGLILAGFPLVLIVIGGAYLWAVMGVVALLSGVHTIRTVSCPRCLNFSCPANRVPEDVRSAYFTRNGRIRAAWNDAGREVKG